MSRILGIDPGSNITGYGIVEVDNGQNRYIDCGAIRTPREKPLAERLKTIFESLSELIVTYQPNEVAVEQVFMHRNADSALKLGQARGVALCAAAVASLEVNEYAPRCD